MQILPVIIVFCWPGRPYMLLGSGLVEHNNAVRGISPSTLNALMRESSDFLTCGGRKENQIICGMPKIVDPFQSMCRWFIFKTTSGEFP